MMQVYSSVLCGTLLLSSAAQALAALQNKHLSWGCTLCGFEKGLHGCVRQHHALPRSRCDRRRGGCASSCTSGVGSTTASSPFSMLLMLMPCM
jgi:hypothetical protein